MCCCSFYLLLLLFFNNHSSIMHDSFFVVADYFSGLKIRPSRLDQIFSTLAPPPHSILLSFFSFSSVHLSLVFHKRASSSSHSHPRSPAHPWPLANPSFAHWLSLFFNFPEKFRRKLGKKRTKKFRWLATFPNLDRLIHASGHHVRMALVKI